MKKNFFFLNILAIGFLKKQYIYTLFYNRISFLILFNFIFFYIFFITSLNYTENIILSILPIINLTKNSKKINPYWISGLCDMSSSFTIIVSLRKNGKWELRPSFEILTNKHNLTTINQIYEFFGAGKIYTNSTQVIFRVTKLEELINVIIPHFINYPLISKKLLSFQLWSQAISLFQLKAHLNPTGIQQILSIYASLNKGVSPTVAKHFPNIIPTEIPIYSLPTELNPWWISGYLSFNCNMQIKVDAAGWKNNVYNKLRIIFSFSRHSSELPIINLIRDFFGVGNVYLRSKENRCDYNLVNHNDLYYVFFSHFNEYPFCSSKDKNAELFMEAIKIANNKEFFNNSKAHLRIYEIVELMSKI